MMGGFTLGDDRALGLALPATQRFFLISCPPAGNPQISILTHRTSPPLPHTLHRPTSPRHASLEQRQHPDPHTHTHYTHSTRTMSLPALDREVSHVSSKVSASNAGDKGRIARLRSGVWGAAGRAASVASVATLGTLNAQPPSDAQRKAEMVQLNGFTGVFPVPAPGCRPSPPAALTTSQSEAYDRMLRYFKEQVTQYPISLSPGAAKEPATDWEKLRLLSRESLLRYLRAAKWDVQQAQKRLVETIAWRREFGVDKLDPDEMAHEAKSGKETVLGYDNKARPLHYMHPHRNDTKVRAQSPA